LSKSNVTTTTLPILRHWSYFLAPYDKKCCIYGNFG